MLSRVKFVASLEYARWSPEPSLYRVLFSHGSVIWLNAFLPVKLWPPNRGLSNFWASIPLKQRLNFEIWSFNNAEFLFLWDLLFRKIMEFWKSIFRPSSSSNRQGRSYLRAVFLDLNDSFRTPLLSRVVTKPYNIYRWPWIIVAPKHVLQLGVKASLVIHESWGIKTCGAMRQTFSLNTCVLRFWVKKSTITFFFMML